MAVTLEDEMLGNREKNIEIARRPAIGPGSAFARQTDAGAFFHSRRYVHIQGAFLLHQTRAAAGLAGIADDLAAAAAGRAGALDGEKALGGSDLAMTGAGGAGVVAGARCPGPARAAVAGRHGWRICFVRPRGESFFRS